MNDVNSYQEGGDHYSRGGKIQHWDYVEQNGLGYLEGCATKYVTRWRTKHPTEELQRQDLQKARHYVEKLIDLAEPTYFYCDGLPYEIPGSARKNRCIKTPVITPEEFGHAYGLIAEEVEIITILHFWDARDQLVGARDLIDGLLEK